MRDRLQVTGTGTRGRGELANRKGFSRDDTDETE